MTFSTPLVTDAWEPEGTEVNSEQMQEVKEDVVNDPLTDQLIWPTVHTSFSTRTQACNALMHGHPNGYQSPIVESMDAQELPPWYINVVIDESTGEAHIPAIVDELMGEINAVFDPVTARDQR